LPKGKMGVDLAGDFAVDYVVDPEKKKVVHELQKAAAKATAIYLATDPDREGEAISWHVKWILENAKTPVDGERVSRVVFHEITKEAVEEALKSARDVDVDLVNAQQGRRVLDRVVGYSLSPMLWKKVRRGLSAGRVQSVAVRLVCEREKEIGAFEKEKFFKVKAILTKEGVDFVAELEKVDDKRVVVSTKVDLFDGDYTYSKSIFGDRLVADGFVAGLGKEFEVEKVVGKEVMRTPLPPFTTSKLQQAAARRMGWSGKQTMSVAQKLYEKGLITYHRTDSVYLSVKAVEDFRKFIVGKYGVEYAVAKADRLGWNLMVRAWSHARKNYTKWSGKERWPPRQRRQKQKIRLLNYLMEPEFFCLPEQECCSMGFCGFRERSLRIKFCRN